MKIRNWKLPAKGWSASGGKISSSHKGFSLIEFLVGIFIFSICFGLTIMSVRLASGKEANYKTKTISNGLRNAIETINSKMDDPNNKATIGTENIYGFRVLNNNILAISLRPRGTDECLFIGRREDTVNNDFYLAMKQNPCNSVPSLGDLNQRLTSKKIKVTNFDISNNYFFTDPVGDPNSAKITPYLTIKISVEDPADQTIKFDWQTSYALSYLTVQSFLSPNFEATK
ncbi:MAG: prepilin-type N-terminal cleavage/methylation domain-containing protein [Patescibacteria group bacterium]